MSTRYNNGSHYENHQRAAELEKLPEHAHAAAEHTDKQEHLTDHEQTRTAEAHTKEVPATVGHGITTFGHKEIEELAHHIWESKGRPEGTSEQDWYEAVRELRTRAMHGQNA